VALGTSAKKKFNKQLITNRKNFEFFWKIFWTFAKNAKALARLSVGHHSRLEVTTPPVKDIRHQPGLERIP
jgi:hypothetical protein